MLSAVPSFKLGHHSWTGLCEKVLRAVPILLSLSFCKVHLAPCHVHPDGPSLMPARPCDCPVITRLVPFRPLETGVGGHRVSSGSKPPEDSAGLLSLA